MPEHIPFEEKAPFAERYQAVRDRTASLAEGLSDADATAQSMEDASPAKWHLAHTSWFFESFILTDCLKDYSVFHPQYEYLFNSYYEAVGERHARPRRGLLTRPSLDEVMAYRAHVDEAMQRLLQQAPAPALAALVDLGLHHEQQHQELFLTDILHLFAQNPLKPGYGPGQPLLAEDGALPPSGWHRHEGGLVRVGHEGGRFAFDCEGPAHEVYLRPFELAHRAVTNGEWRTFMEDGGYASPVHWLSDGWETVNREGWEAPLYWQKTEDGWSSMTLRGFQPVDPDAPVTHVSFYEADAYASWAGYRLPTEHEWEAVAAAEAPDGNFAGSGRLRPRAQRSEGLTGLYGDVWEWTASPFTAYPGFTPSAGAVGEYNGKFMSGQMVLRGGSCVTPENHLRATYRNFFHPCKRWQFSGLRLARDC